MSCEQGEHGNHSGNQRCYTVSMFRQDRLKAVHLGEEGRAPGGERALQRMQMGGHVWFHQGHLQKTQVLHSLTIKGRGACYGVITVVRTAFPGARQFIEQLWEDRDGLLRQGPGQ